MCHQLQCGHTNIIVCDLLQDKGLLGIIELLVWMDSPFCIEYYSDESFKGSTEGQVMMVFRYLDTFLSLLLVKHITMKYIAQLISVSK